MIFNLNNDIEQQRAKERLTWLISKGKRIEIKELREKRSSPQNAYLHLLLSYFAIEVGETLSVSFFAESFSQAVNKSNRAKITPVFFLGKYLIMSLCSYSASLAQRKPKLSFLTFLAKKARLNTGADIPHL